MAIKSGSNPVSANHGLKPFASISISLLDRIRTLYTYNIVLRIQGNYIQAVSVKVGMCRVGKNIINSYKIFFYICIIIILLSFIFYRLNVFFFEYSFYKRTQENPLKKNHI